MKQILLIIMGLWFALVVCLSQNDTTISGTPNHYLQVDEVLSDQVRVTETISGETSYFKAGDKVLLIQMTGVTKDSPIDFKTTASRIKKAIEKTGLFEILQVEDITTSGLDTFVVFTDNLSNSYDPGEKIQLVRFVEGKKVTISGSTLTARKWDGRVGGIVAVIGTESIKLNDNINVSAQGFRGGVVPIENYTGGCRYDLSTTIKDTLYFFPTETNRSGNKGEGVITVSWPYTKGTGFSINGGGAGNGQYSGGGGGSNFRQGGDGGRQSTSCTAPYSVLGGWGGYACQELYQLHIDNPNNKPRVIMGGGGGSGTKLNVSSLSKGGDGGGLVFLITDTLVSNGNSISANGESAINTTGSGGGGGAGGSILIDATYYSGSLNIYLKGGKGGNTTMATYCNGAGGGGSGGVFWCAGSTFPAAFLDTTKGAFGYPVTAGDCYDQNGTYGSNGTRLKNLIMPLNGFLFNTIKGKDTVCAGLAPNMLTASQPKGGNGTYAFTWEQSTDNLYWAPASASVTPTLRTFQPTELSQTTYYRRIVSSNGITDISRAVKIYVYPAIANNGIIGTDTICFNSDAKPLNGIATPINGGNGLFNFQWQESIDQAIWNPVGSNATFDPGILTTTTYYRRIANSTIYCQNTSNTLTIKVLPVISNNGFITGDSAVCYNRSPGILDAKSPGGGDGIYSYLWQSKTLTGNWNSIPSSNILQYTAGVLSESTAYRRIVYSGNGDACIDTGVVKTINTMPLITNNSILGDPVQYTCFNTAIALQGSLPANGFGPGTYNYQWEQSADNSFWQPVTETTRNYETSNLTTTQFFRRTVYSTPLYHECTDLSNTVEVRINPLPTGNVIGDIDTICAGETIYVKFNVAGNGPFNVTIDGGALPNQTKTGINLLYDSIAFVPVSAQQYTIQPFAIYSVEDDSGCFAAVSAFTDTAKITVYQVPMANAGADAPVCGEEYTLNAAYSVAGNHSGFWTATGVIFSDPESTNSSVTSDSYGPKVFTWTETNRQCTDDDEVVITFYEPPQTPEAGADQLLDFKYTTQLQAVPVSVGNGQWTILSGSGEFDNDTSPDAIISQLTNSTILEWTVINGNCPSVSDIMEILVNPLVIPKGFTPNNDYKNDEFDIGAINAERIRIKVFNSTGVLVFESDDYLEGDLWDGHNMNGVELPEGTYFYLINIKVAGKKDEVQFRSFVEIMR